MASSSSSSNPTISQDELKLFHTMDRNIFSRLVLNLQRDTGESMYVMAFFLCLEKCSSHGRNLVHSIQFWPDNLLNALADEAIICFNAIKSDDFSFDHSNSDNDTIPLIQRLTENEVSLRFIHERRLDITRGIVQVVQDVSVRAFDDITQYALGLTSQPEDDQERTEQKLKPSEFHNPYIRLPHRKSLKNLGYCVHPCDLKLEAQRESLNNEMEELLKDIYMVCIHKLDETDGDDDNNNNSNEEEVVEEEEVAEDDRSIFLTFSRGYPISKNEVTDFFIKKFGENLMDRVDMQPVPARKQPLYAKMVLKPPSGIELVLNGEHKAKFTINGKHTWCRKYEPKKP